MALSRRPCRGGKNFPALQVAGPRLVRLVPLGTPTRLRGQAAPRKSLILLAPRAGFEPATNRLTANPNTISLTIIKVHRLLISAYIYYIY